jgi:Pyruvate/2-oxoglutarate dehydrogenase complex, dihydrolipoamide acyltransferase (E2) component, and related enzymes
MSRNKLEQLAKLRERFKTKKGGGTSKSGDVYPHWDIEEDTTATVRILEDKNPDNPNVFYVEKLTHKLSVQDKHQTIACVKMFGEKCPICDLSYKFYKAEGDKSKSGRYYYCNRQYLLKALILKDPIKYEEEGQTAVGQVKTLNITSQIMDEIKKAISNTNEETALSAIPWDVDEGHNFIIHKTKKGDYFNYSGSSFSGKITAIDDKYMDAVEAGSVDLSTLLPENPGVEKLQALLEAHLNGGEVPEADASPVARTRQAEAEVETEVAEAEEAPIRRRRPAAEEVVEAAEEAPVRRRRVVEDDAADEAPVARKTASKPAVVEAEVEADAPDGDGEDEEEAFIRRVMAERKTKK